MFMLVFVRPKGRQNVTKNTNWDMAARLGTRVHSYALLFAHDLLYGSVCCK